MSTAEQVPPIRSVAEFLDWEERQEERYEFVDGVIRMMAGGTMVHNWLCRKLANALDGRLPRHCRAFTEKVKLRIAEDVLYPDVLLTCDTADMTATRTVQALLAAEVLSPSTPKREHDGRQKLYLAVPELRHYLVIAQDALRVEVITPLADGGSRVDVYEAPNDIVALPGLELAVPLAEVYHRSGLLPGEDEA